MSAAIYSSRSGDWRKSIGLATLLIPIGLLLLLGIGELAGGHHRTPAFRAGRAAGPPRYRRLEASAHRRPRPDRYRASLAILYPFVMRAFAL
jgi:hypothetical protein